MTLTLSLCYTVISGTALLIALSALNTFLEFWEGAGPFLYISPVINCVLFFLLPSFHSNLFSHLLSIPFLFVSQRLHTLLHSQHA